MQDGFGWAYGFRNTGQEHPILIQQNLKLIISELHHFMKAVTNRRMNPIPTAAGQK